MTRDSTRIRLAAAMTTLALVCGCASGPRTTVILLPDEDGHVGAVSVHGAQQAQDIDRAFHGVTVLGARAEPSTQSPLGQEAVSATYSLLMKSQPPRPATFVLRFELDSPLLTSESRALIPTMIDAEHRRAPTEIAVFGHADALGEERHNYRLSLQRAQAVADLLMHADPTIRHIDVKAFGNSKPLPGSSSRGAEPRNRRVEVQIL